MTYRTESQQKISDALGEDVIYFIHTQQKSGKSYRLIAGIIRDRTGINMRPKTLSRWVYSNRTGR